MLSIFKPKQRCYDGVKSRNNENTSKKVECITDNNIKIANKNISKSYLVLDYMNLFPIIFGIYLKKNILKTSKLCFALPWSLYNSFVLSK